MTSFQLLPGEKWSGTIGKNKLIKVTTLGGEANLSTLLFFADDYSERYNMPDTLKAQHTAHLTTGNVLMSDNGKALVSIIDDSVGWHDPIGGYTNRLMTDTKYGKTSYQDKRNDWLRSGEENFIVELIRNGLTQRDLSPPINFFSKIVCDLEGRISYIEKHAKSNDYITLRTELDTLFVFSNTPHPLNPKTSYPNTVILFEVFSTEPADDKDICFIKYDENKRSFENTWKYLNLR
ncbi:urea amidolyase associated protein UAAP1 [Paenibacillus crassostreae]|uniref:Urea carboxylase n=1 Tax=Paenibacillus crassostreae TaxID=1763538 RepID=A0A162KW56_9BACL|nr:urea amidolyase associated protein UAAP1 [Paenibacillus crassostreae]AOZ94533.1 urea carboxylase [Paenibacillus crassostreae]OAB74923.1 urea carboxylase [Paenibacillus crassostreae]